MDEAIRLGFSSSSSLFYVNWIEIDVVVVEGLWNLYGFLRYGNFVYMLKKLNDEEK